MSLIYPPNAQIRLFKAVCFVSVLTLSALGPLVALADDTRTQQALTFAKQGDDQLAKDNGKEAATAYAKALHLDLAAFGAERVLDYVSVLASNDMLDDAIQLLTQLREAQPNHLQTHIQLARYLSWNGQLKTANRVITRALSLAPTDKEAQLVKANIALWSGDYRTALYSLPVNRHGNDKFDLQLTLINALLDRGENEWAGYLRSDLKPQYDYQRDSITGIDRRLIQATHPGLSYAIECFSDNSQTDRIDHLWRLSYPTPRTTFGLSYQNTATQDDSMRITSRRAVSEANYRPSPGWNLIAAMGHQVSDTPDMTESNVGTLAIKVSRPSWSGSLESRRDTLLNTPKAILNEIRLAEQLMRLNLLLSDDLSIDLNALQRTYSNDNGALIYRVSPWYTVRRHHPAINVGYRREHQQFRREAKSGYYDPSMLDSNRVYLTVSHRANLIKGSLEVGYGQQSYFFYGSHGRSETLSYYASLHYDLSRRMSLELVGEGSDSAFSTPGGYKYNSLSASAQVYF